MDWDEVLRHRLGDAAERMSTPRFRFEVRRKAFHVTGAVLAVPIFLFLPVPWALAFGGFVVFALAGAYLIRERRLRVGEPVEALTEPIGEAIAMTRRPGETFPWAPISFTLALMAVGLAVSLSGLPRSFAFAAYGILGFGDAASALVGVAYGAHKLPWNRKKSWEGTIAGILGGFAAAVALAAVDFAGVGRLLPTLMLPVIATAAVVGALIETLPNVQDNWAVPVGSLVAMTGVAWLLGVV